jgi:hypothetical protein
MIDEAIARLLTPGETVLWRQNTPPAAMLGQKIFGLVLCVPFAAAGAFLIYLGIVLPAAAGGHLFAFVLGSVFALLGFSGLIYGVYDLFQPSRGRDYVLTDQRVIISSRESTQSFTAEAFAKSAHHGDAARGDIHFAWGTIGRRGAQGYAHTLSDVEDPARVRALIIATLRNAGMPPAPKVCAGEAPHPLIAAALEPNERALWSARAPAWALARSKLLALIVLAVFAAFGSLALAAGLNIDNMGEPGDVQWPPLLIGALFVGFSLWISTLIVYDAITGWETYYALTPKRLMIVTPRRIQSYAAPAFARLEREGSDKRGTLNFDWRDGGSRGGFSASMIVDDPIAVEARLRAVLRPH